MKKIFLSTTALIAMTAMAAAADLPARTVAPAPLPVVAPVFTWSGFYAGINGGYVWNDVDARYRSGIGGFFDAGVAAGVVPDRVDLSSDGFTFGGHVGGNVQFGVFVAGLEADIAYTDVGRTRAFAGGGGATGFTPRTTTLSSDMDFFGTVRGRIGLGFDRFLVYGTGGLAYAGVNTRGTIRSDLAVPAFGTFTSNGDDDDIRVGYAVGVGAEYAFTNNLTVGVEYLYYDLGDENVRLTNAAGNTATYRFDHTGDIIRGRLSFKF
jgi:outer membrane immunogenic protein